ncbi:MAG: LacI family DNA-binding transcriptional regulator [Lachnospiraceae bacterium]|nr:LacI family DNA-binding transcriptional regulator [Lachnospiraceae bacterium]
MDSEKKITIYDIAREAGVSASQVSRAISGRGYVSEETQAKISELVEKYNYRPNAVARNLQRGQSNTVGFLIPHVYQEYFPLVYSVFEREMTEKGYVTVVFNGKSTPADEIKNLNLLEELRVDAVVIIGGSLDFADWESRKDYVEAIKRISRNIPCILGNERAGTLSCSGVYVNIDKGVDDLVRHLSELGHKTMGILGGFRTVHPSFRLQESLKKSGKKYGLEFRPEWQVFSSYNSHDGAEAMRKLLQQKELPTAVCCINDEIAVGAMGVAMDMGMRIPEDIAFTGYDGVDLSREFRPQLTTIQMDFETMGKKLAELAYNSIKGDRTITEVIVDPAVVLRHSTEGGKK